MADKSQIDLLAEYIMNEIPGEPSQSEGAGDTAIRLLKQYRAKLQGVPLVAVAFRAYLVDGVKDLVILAPDVLAARRAVEEIFAPKQGDAEIRVEYLSRIGTETVGMIILDK